MGCFVFRDCGELTAETEPFAALLSAVQMFLAGRADEVTEVVCGIALRVK